jgi:predicted NUDIX family NTP pyrophosphohydrolase
MLDVARREFAEETGHPVPDGAILDLGTIVQKGGKVVFAWAVEGDLDPALAISNTFDMEWPPKSGRTAAYPEIDRVAWFDGAEARVRVKAAQIPLLERLEAELDLIR